MKMFLKNIILFFFILLVIGEIIVRLTHVISDIPQRTIDVNRIQKYLPNQRGYWKGGEHTWTINKLGWPGQLPENFDNLILLIGDSFIENFMNPNECHQSTLLKKNFPEYNFMEAARSGINLIEAMEISKHLDSLNPISTLIYVSDLDFYESIIEIRPMTDVTQLNLEKNSIVAGQLKSTSLKKVLYNWKLLYYFYNRFYSNFQGPENPLKHKSEDANILQTKIKVIKLLNYISKNYKIKDKILVFHPNSNAEIIEECKNVGFNIIELDSYGDEDWTFGHDPHWTCYGHKKITDQISNNLKK